MKIEMAIPESVVELVVKGILENMPEASSAFQCRRWRYEEWDFVFYDYEEKKEYRLNKAQWLAAFPLLFSDKWPAGCTKPPFSAELSVWNDWLCECDATDFDAFVQLACMSEVIYG